MNNNRYKSKKVIKLCMDCGEEIKRKEGREYYETGRCRDCWFNGWKRAIKNVSKDK